MKHEHAKAVSAKTLRVDSFAHMRIAGHISTSEFFISFSTLKAINNYNAGGRGVLTIEQHLIREGLHSESRPSPSYKPFLTAKVPLS